MKINEMQNGYVQPECQVFDVDIEQIIAVSGESGTEKYEEENYQW